MNMARRVLLLMAAASFVLAAVAAVPGAAGDSIPSGERAFGQNVIEPVYNDEQAGAIGYVSTPMRAPDPVKSDPRAWSPFYLPVYPVGSTVGTLLCRHTPTENCPTHGDLIAALAKSIMPSVYGVGVLGHDHLMDFPGGSDFNISWEPTLVLFTKASAANEHILTDAQIDAAVERGDAIEVPLPPATFLCAAVSGNVYERATPL
jgi:hypothetical protein